MNLELMASETSKEIEESPAAAPVKDENFWRRVREDFPITKKFTYLRSAATGALAPGVATAVNRYYEELATSGDCAWDMWVERRERARAAIARMINAEPCEIAFTVNTSTGMNLIVDALETRGAVISCDLEFPVSTLPWLHRGIDVNRITARDGVVSVEQIEAAMTPETGVLCLSHVQYSNGLRLDLETIGARKRHHAFVVNASQSAGVLGIDVRRMRIDALCATGHKWMLAGLGTGFVFISRAILEQTRARVMSWMSTPDPFAMRNDEATVREDAAARAEIGVPTFASIFALGAGVDYLSALGGEAIEQRALELNRYLTARLTQEGYRVLSPLKDESARSAETLVAHDDPERIAAELTAQGILVSQKPEGIRIATHFYNNEADIEHLVEALNAER
jgi:selenocysteine lyase/cysteine desulfurase